MFHSRLVLTSAVLLFAFSVCRASSLRQEVTEENPRGGIIWITVHTKNDSFPDLSAADLEVKLNGKLASVTDTRRVSPTLHYCFLLDISGSTRSARTRQHQEAVALLSKIPRADRDYGFLVSFNDQAYLEGEGADPQKLIQSISQDSRGATAVYDAMIACSDYLFKKDAPQDGSYTLNVIFLLSDGVDNASGTNREDAERALLSGGIRVYSIGQENVGRSSPDQVTSAKKSLKRMVGTTGGKEYPLNKGITIDRIVRDISSDLDGLYAVRVSPEKALSIGHAYKLEVRCRKPAVTAPREYLSSH
jgi:hypothetical protein